MIGERDYSDARFPVPMGLKDVELVLQAAERVAVPLPFAEIVRAHLLVAQVTGRSHEDWSALAEYATEDVASEAVSGQGGRPEQASQ
jgi:3-hydroxyisobutyrate dehydrogenase-like beta-hydroxyacid dehydrogenase